jgi:DNA-binding PadR family transcriptional regulator
MKHNDADQSSFGPPWLQGGPGNWPKVLQAGRGNIKPIILQALSEKPMHGYEIIQHFAKRSGGHWRPSPGSVYPTLRKLEAEGSIIAKQVGGKTEYYVTASGRKQAEEQSTVNPWEGIKHPDLLAKIGPVMREFMPLMHQLAMDGSKADAERAVVILEEAITKLKSLKKEIKEKK